MAKTAPATGRIQPSSIEMEAQVIGAMLLDKIAVAKGIELLTDDVFYDGKHRKIFQSIVKMFDKNDPIDMITVAEELRRTGSLEKCGGEMYLADLTTKVTSGANIEYHARVILEKSIARGIIAAGSTAAARAYDGTEDIFELLDESQQALFDVAEKKIKKGFVSSRVAMHKTLEYLEKIHGTKSGLVGVPTGFTKLDQLTGGWRRSDLIIVAGRPSSGKTAFALGLCRNAATNQDKPVGVGIFSLEMSTEQLMIRLATGEARVNSHQVQTGRLPEEEWKRLSIASGRIAQADLWIDDSAALSILELRAKARRLKAEKNVGMIVVDYLQLMSGSKNSDSREKEIASISRGLKALAKELDVPVIALSQLSRAIDARANKRPILSDLRESGAIEQDADVVAFVHRPEMYLDSDNKRFEHVAGKAEIIVAKQRNGPLDTINLTFVSQYSKFENPAPAGFAGGPPTEKQDDQVW